VLAQSPKYPALYDPHSGVRFRSARAEVTEEQALLLAERRYTDGILIDGTPAKDWAKTRRRAEQDTPPDTTPDPAPDPVPAEGRRARKAN
jgi:hypothetical protein